MITLDNCKMQKSYADSMLEILEKWRTDDSIEKTESDYQVANALFNQLSNLSKGMALIEKILSGDAKEKPVKKAKKEEPKIESTSDDLDDLF